MAEKQEREIRNVNKAGGHVWVADAEGHPRKISTERNNNAGVIVIIDGKVVIRPNKAGWKLLDDYVLENDGAKGLEKLEAWKAYHERKAFKAGDTISEKDIPPCLVPVTATAEKLAARPRRRSRKAMQDALSRIEAKEAKLDEALAKLEALEEGKGKKGGAGQKPAA